MEQQVIDQLNRVFSENLAHGEQRRVRVFKNIDGEKLVEELDQYLSENEL